MKGDNVKRSGSVFGLIAAGALAVVLGAACSSSSKSSPSSTPAGSGSSGPSSSAPAGGPTAADPSKSPVLVGFHNLEGGAISLPDVRAGFMAGIDYVNTDLGGINGHPMQAVTCNTDGTPEASLNCANQFVQKNVVAAVQGVDFGADSMLPVLKSANLIETGFISLTPGLDKAVGDAYFSGESAEEGYAADLVEQQKLGAKSVAVVMVDNAASHATYTGIIAPAGVKLGLTTKVYYYPTQADWTSLSATILSTKPDAVSLFTDDPDALAAVPAFRSAGFTGYIDAGGNSDIAAKLSTDVLKNVMFTSSFYGYNFTDLPAKVQADVDTFNKYIKKDGPNVQAMNQAQQGYFIAVEAADMLRQIKADPLTAQAVHDGIGTTSGTTQVFRTSPWDCAKPSWPGTTACASGAFFAITNSSKQLVALPNQPVDISSVRPSS